MKFDDADAGGADMDPRAAAQYAQGAADAADEGLSGGMESSGGGFPGSGGDGPMRRLFDGDAEGPSTTELESEYGLERWQSVFGRGILRTATGSGVPPVAEILLGGVMGFAKGRGGDGGDAVDAIEGEQSQPGGDVGGEGL